MNVNVVVVFNLNICQHSFIVILQQDIYANIKHLWISKPTLLPSSNTSMPLTLLMRCDRQKWRESVECDVSWKFCKCCKLNRANVVLVLTTNCEFNWTKLGRGGGECVEGAAKVLWSVRWFQFYMAKVSKTHNS